MELFDLAYDRTAAASRVCEAISQWRRPEAGFIQPRAEARVLRTLQPETTSVLDGAGRRFRAARTLPTARERFGQVRTLGKPAPQPSFPVST